MRVIVHIGLAVLIALAPALCCCQLSGLIAVTAATPYTSALPDSRLEQDCCVHAVKRSCCQEIETPSQKPPPPQAPSRCVCCAERAIAAQTEARPQFAPAEPTGEIIPLAHLLPVAGEIVFATRTDGRYPWHRAGTDAQYESLFLRHTLLC